MGFFLSILYFVTDYLTPATIFGPLAAYRIELIFAILLTLISIPSLIGSMLGKTPQTLALAGLAFATVISSVVSVQWLGGGVSAFMLFVPNAFAYFLVCLHCNTKRRLQILVLMMLFVCLFVIGQGALGLYRGLPTPNPDDPRAVNMDESYFFAMSNSAGEWFYRLRGMGEIHDPNDFSQLIVCVLPLVFIFWKQKRTILNIFFVILPVCILLWGAYLTHSRGSLLALLAVGIMAARRRIGTIPSLILAGVLFAGATALNYTGGRDISANAGEDRTELWSESMQIFKAHPFFGIGFGDLPEYLDHTAHNTVLVCAAELGLFGLFFWSLFLFPTLRDALVIASPGKVEEGQQPIVPERTLYQQPMRKVELLDKEEINRLGRLMVLSLTGFLVAGWFLSRAYVLTLFLLGGMTEVIFEMALQRGMISPRLPVPRVLRYSGVMTVSLVVMMYILVRILNLTR